MQDPVLILGATGSIGGAIAKRLVATRPVVLHGRNQKKLTLLKSNLSNSEHKIESDYSQALQ